MNQILFLVPSVIYFANNPLSYSNVRSVFTPEERCKQTVQTIESIRSKVPGATILLVEMGLQHAPDDLRMLADRYLYIGHRRFVREAVDGPHKGYGEAIGLLLANRLAQSLQPDYYFKLSGRYCLNGDFDLRKWNSGEFTCQEGPGWISTRIYGFPAAKYNVWRHCLKQAIPPLLQGESIENAMWRFLPQVHTIAPLGVSGVIAPWNQAVSD